MNINVNQSLPQAAPPRTPLVRLREVTGGVDLRVVAEARRGGRARNAHLVWVGKSRDTAYDHYVSQEIKARGLGNVHFVGERVADYYDHLGCADGFVLTSRHDPFPLVMIEAAYLGKPIVSFNSGGVRGFLQQGMGEVVESWNVADLAAAMSRVMTGETTTDPAVSRARALEFDLKAGIGQWESLLLTHVAGAPAPAPNGTPRTGVV
jgi:glycosyltransferase involved in cell wall biosynthesis